jgi:methylmalonyl-CoA mutase cobalamin-binding subunit
MHVGAFYRPPDKTDEDYLNKVKEEISTIKEKHRRDIFVIGGGLHLHDINWEEQAIINRQYPIKTNQTFLEIVASSKFVSRMC